MRYIGFHFSQGKADEIKFKMDQRDRKIYYIYERTIYKQIRWLAEYE